MSPVNLYLVIPCYNEEEVLPETFRRTSLLFEEMKEKDILSHKSRIVFVDDGSRDKTWELILDACSHNSMFQGIKLSQNCGHQNALLSGLMTVKDKADCVISMDADLQDDLYAIYDFIKKFQEGKDVVYGVRKNRKRDTFLKRGCAHLFYRFMRLLGADVVYNHADFRLMSRRALSALSEFKETNLFLRGMVPLVGFSSDVVYYTRGERFAGESKYPLSKMLSFAFDGITSFSIKPIRLISVIGAVFSLIGIIIAIYSLLQKFLGHTVSGWTSIIVSIWFIGGAQLIALGLIGEYIGKIYKETKGRPRYIIEHYTANNDD